ncbi:MAG: Asp-tRNA(Asn)/Glu-tRNA(Gln) amidotransferase subunit GatA [Proteobacteria bacterium]|nr:Asp-tRNA(Asn)/Glu-tRNA(Gln) amidotransferase subunit GatA [Pseudomonadota bacterium]MBU1640570.1 Asp-tRNA(Asn)/Glu-tRNA(Gln) amidotransferase subunit GatA [Pseudomonadota bacterium]
MKLSALTIHEAQDLLAQGETSSLELTTAIFERMAVVEPKVAAYITENKEQALIQAAEADAMRARGEGGALCGIPLAIKDVICTKGLRTTAGSRILENFIPPYDATVMEKLQGQGAVCVGKASMDEFAMGSGNENCAYGTPHNPWNLDHICGGSSGGSAAAVAADECMASLGSDTGGSIRQPASHCGMVGLKPTYGRVSRFGLLAFASSLDQIGPITKDVRDAAIMLNAIAGYDPRDSTSAQVDIPDYTKALVTGLDGLTVGVPEEYFGAGLDPEVEKVIRHGIDQLKAAGAQIKTVSLPHTEYGVAAYYIIAPAEASSNLARYDGVRYGRRDMKADSLIELYKRSRSQGFGDEVKRRILIGTYALSSGYYDAYYKKASQVRTLIVEDYRQAFSACDVLVSPVTPTPAWKIGEKASDPLSVYLSDLLTIPANLAGVPGMSVPCGFSAAGLPIGLQIQGSHFSEETLLKVAYNLEQGLHIVGKKPIL